MKTFIITFLLLGCMNGLSAQNTGVEMHHLKINQDVAKIQTIRGFYKNVLGLRLHSPPGKITRDFLQFDNGQRLNLIYMAGEKVPSNEDFIKGLWIRIETDRFDEISWNVKKADTKIIREVEGKELYFQAPGGQVWRMVKKD